MVPLQFQASGNLPMHQPHQLNPADLENFENLPPGVRKVSEWLDDGGGVSSLDKIPSQPQTFTFGTLVQNSSSRPAKFL